MEDLDLDNRSWISVVGLGYGWRVLDLGGGSWFLGLEFWSWLKETWVLDSWGIGGGGLVCYIIHGVSLKADWKMLGL